MVWISAEAWTECKFLLLYRINSKQRRLPLLSFPVCGTFHQVVLSIVMGVVASCRVSSFPRADYLQTSKATQTLYRVSVAPTFALAALIAIFWPRRVPSLQLASCPSFLFFHLKLKVYLFGQVNAVIFVAMNGAVMQFAVSNLVLTVSFTIWASRRALVLFPTTV